MKTSGELFNATSLEDWLAQGRWPGSLAVSATCGCDVTRLGEEICDYLNAREGSDGELLMSFDREDIRRLAGEPSLRRKILSAVAEPENFSASGSDYECMIRSVASLGGAILAGQCCLDATRGMPNVFRVMVSSCGRCPKDDPSMRLDPARFTTESLVEVIAASFANWCRRQPSATDQPLSPGKETTTSRVSLSPVAS